MDQMSNSSGFERRRRFGATPARSRERQSRLTAVVTVIAALLLVATGTLVFVNARNALAAGEGSNPLLVVTLALNIALILVGWRRHADLSREVKERGAAEKRAREMADRDPLTGFLNRRAFADAGLNLLQRGRKRQRSLAVLVIDLDNFKTINDLHGHGTGDALIAAVAAEIYTALPKDALAARLGGDEFACAFLYTDQTSDLVNHVAAKIVARLGLPFDAAGIHAHISASIGIACADRETAHMDEAIRRADIAMYAAKHAGRNRHFWFDSSMERALQDRQAIEAGLRSGMPRGEFVPFFEQQIDFATGQLQGFEVLARWNSPERGLIAPDKFLPAAEETGLIGELSLMIIRQALEYARDWDPSLTLSVNIAPSQLKDPWLSQKLVKLLVETGFSPNRLEVEITESALFENITLAQSIVGSLKNQGIRLALDDFGTGYSSLAHLRALPFDRIKIDRSFVSSINENPESAAIVNAITRLSDSLGLPVTAEGVETELIEQRLRTLGVHMGQGWFFGKPMPVDQTVKLLAEKNLLPSKRYRGDHPRVENFKMTPRAV